MKRKLVAIFIFLLILLPSLLFASSLIYDGPHIIWENNSTIEVFYLVYDSLKDEYETINKTFSNIEGIFKFNGFGPDKSKKKYTIFPEKYPPKAICTNVPKIFAVGDLHGEYESIVNILRNSKIVDENLDWNWGENHLVFCGDVFDRGGKVTECLWLIYKISNQAEKVGGKVHLVLGNHEIMVMKNDLRYLCDKYQVLCDSLGFDYSKLFAKNTELGKWLRMKNAVKKINNLLFVHAGISPELYEKKLKITKINESIRNHLRQSNKEKVTETEKFLVKSFGPFWYRGYFHKMDKYPKISTEILQNILEFYEAKSVIVAHTHVDKIEPFYDGLLFGLDVPMGYEDIEEQALLIENGKFFRININGEKELIYIID